jgi:hypothetical protein
MRKLRVRAGFADLASLPRPQVSLAAQRATGPAHPFMDCEAERDCQFPQRAEKEFLRLVAEIAPRYQLEIPERAVVALEPGAQYCKD